MVETGKLVIKVSILKIVLRVYNVTIILMYVMCYDRKNDFILRWNVLTAILVKCLLEWREKQEWQVLKKQFFFFISIIHL